jgi:hypothetical protein
MDKIENSSNHPSLPRKHKVSKRKRSTRSAHKMSKFRINKNLNRTHDLVEDQISDHYHHPEYIHSPNERVSSKVMRKSKKPKSKKLSFKDPLPEVEVKVHLDADKLKFPPDEDQDVSAVLYITENGKAVPVDVEGAKPHQKVKLHSILKNPNEKPTLPSIKNHYRRRNSEDSVSDEAAEAYEEGAPKVCSL